MAHIWLPKLYVPPKSAHESDASGVDVLGMACPWNNAVQCGGVEPAPLSVPITS